MFALAQYMGRIGFVIVPGDKLCPFCLKEINDLKLETEEKQHSSMADDIESIEKLQQDTSFGVALYIPVTDISVT